mmetsp:Transcript_23124/g.64953  ORF Transcript_23124/g.64953 Transcript_23124/m.64953 type:complete len:374 (+) Transcript_23124:517-1638(+)
MGPPSPLASSTRDPRAAATPSSPCGGPSSCDTASRARQRAAPWRASVLMVGMSTLGPQVRGTPLSDRQKSVSNRFFNRGRALCAASSTSCFRQSSPAPTSTSVSSLASCSSSSKPFTSSVNLATASCVFTLSDLPSRSQTSEGRSCNMVVHGAVIARWSFFDPSDNNLSRAESRAWCSSRWKSSSSRARTSSTSTGDVSISMHVLATWSRNLSLRLSSSPCALALKVAMGRFLTSSANSDLMAALTLSSWAKRAGLMSPKIFTISSLFLAEHTAWSKYSTSAENCSSARVRSACDLGPKLSSVAPMASVSSCCQPESARKSSRQDCKAWSHFTLATMTLCAGRSRSLSCLMTPQMLSRLMAKAVPGMPALGGK